MCMSSPKAPAPPPPPPEAPQPINQDQTGSYDREKRRQKSAGSMSTILTGVSGLSASASVGKSLLGG